jgi:DNA-directed RNA polymerase I subunit RPA1
VISAAKFADIPDF